jgi:glutaredoxin-like YruB-family protein
MKSIQSYKELKNELIGKEKAYLLLYKSEAENSDCALRTIEKVAELFESITFLKTDVKEVRDIHTEFNITTAPALLEFENGQYTNVIKGCNSNSFYKAIFDDAVYKAEIKDSGKKEKRVTVYSTPTCTWCNTIKTYFKQNRIRFTDVDVSKDQKAAEEMVRKSGQQGVPQTDIEGTIIVGFDKKRINELLDLKTK